MSKYFVLALLCLFLAAPEAFARGAMRSAGRAGYVYNNSKGDDTMQTLALGVFALAVVVGVLRFIAGIISFIFGCGDSPEEASRVPPNPWAEEEERKEA